MHLAENIPRVGPREDELEAIGPFLVEGIRPSLAVKAETERKAAILAVRKDTPKKRNWSQTM